MMLSTVSEKDPFPAFGPNRPAPVRWAVPAGEMIRTREVIRKMPTAGP